MVNGKHLLDRWCQSFPHRMIVIIEPWGVLLAVVALLIAVIQFWVDYEDRVSERTVRAWQLVTTAATGNSGKRAALEYLNKEDGLFCFEWLQSKLRWLYDEGNEDAGCIILLKSRVPLVGIDLSPPNPGGVGTYLFDVNLIQANLVRANLTDAQLYGANLTNAQLSRANLTNADLTNADLIGAYLDDANLTNAQLYGANLTNAYLSRANLHGAYLPGANLTDARLTRTILADAYLDDANLTGANLTNANLTNAILTGTDLRDAILRDADLRGVIGLDCSQLKEATGWAASYRDKSLGCGEGIPDPPAQDR